MFITTDQPDTESNPNTNLNPSTKQHELLSIQLNIVTCTFPEKFIRVFTTFRCHCHTPIIPGLLAIFTLAR